MNSLDTKTKRPEITSGCMHYTKQISIITGCL